MRVLTGIQPSGKLHWGNYFGAMKSMFDLQEKGENFMFIANFHAMTTVRDGKALREMTRDVALDYLACGLDPEKSVIYRQSDVPEVQELAWYLSCLTPMGLLERCHSYKDKMAHGFDATHGLFAYPVLMAADILMMNADLVPVGKDQKQHLEVTRDLAGKVNDAFGEGLLKMPEAIISEAVSKGYMKTDGNLADILNNMPQKQLSHYLLTASATVDGNDVTMLEENGSVNAHAPLTVVNTRGFDLPETGDNGTMMFTIVGILAMAGAAAAIILVFKKGKKENAV